MTQYLHQSDTRNVRIPSGLSGKTIRHVFDEASIESVDAALAARRPLLVRGEPGVGKSQLARAAAAALGRVFVGRVVNARTEPDDLLWNFDAVARLADAQVQKAKDSQSPPTDVSLDVKYYIEPGPLWWALNYRSARSQLATRLRRKASEGERVPGEPSAAHGADPKNGVVLLIDEIDKSDTSVPNGLLGALGDRGFDVPSFGRVELEGGEPPLVIITTNEERTLPSAFLRRCFVMHMKIDEKRLASVLRERGIAHLGEGTIDDAVLAETEKLLLKARNDAREARTVPLPGQAEYIDLLNALHELAPNSPAKQLELVVRLQRYGFRKSATQENDEI